MTISLTNNTTVLTLQPSMQWVDEFDWTAVQETRSYSVAGALLADRRLKLAGRPITLFGPDLRSVVSTLFSWSQQPNPPLSLLLRGTTYPVAFDYARPLEVQPLIDYADPLPTHWCFYTLRLITR